MPPVLTLLGGVRWQGTPVVGGRSRTVLATLVRHAPAGVTDARLIEELWGDSAPANPTKALRVVISRTRAATSPDAVLRGTHGYQLGLEPEQVDLLYLGLLVDRARAELAGDDLPAATETAREALRLAETESALSECPLPELARERLDEARLLLGTAHGGSGEHESALPLLEAALRQHPDDESLLAELLRSEAAVRGTGAALERYEAHRADLAHRTGSDPGPRLRRLHSALLATDRPVREGVRYDPTELLGREADLRQLRGLLDSARVTSIVGAGGLGKTRLAHVLGRTAEQPVVHFVELVGVSAPEDVVGELGSALGVRDSVHSRRTLTPEQRADTRSRIAQQLDRVPTLLVLDNCEHLVDAVAELVAFLVATTRDLRVLTTSRAPLNIAAERVHPLGQLGTADAAELFRQRATAARPGAGLPETAVAEVVTRLDGVPLAVELAAAKIRVLSVEEIGTRLEDRFALLRGGDRGAPDRHQTLLAVIEWSWSLLTGSERDALCRLAVFQDGFTPDTAEAVLADLTEQPGEVLEAVRALVDQSLLTAYDTTSGVRYGMLETVREFGRMRSRDRGSEADSLAARRRWARGYAARAVTEVSGPGQLAAVDALAAEESNLADVLRRALAEQDPETVVVLLDALGACWSIRGEHLRIFTLLDSVEAVLDGWAPPPELADHTRSALATLITNASIAVGGSPRRARALLCELGPESGRPEVTAAATLALAYDPDDPASYPARLTRLCGDPNRRIAALAMQAHGHGLENSGDPAAAVGVASRALELTREEDDPWQQAIQRSQLAQLHSQLGQHDEAARHAVLALPVLERLDAADDVVQLRGLVSLSAIWHGRYEEAARAVEDFAPVNRQERSFGGQGAVALSEAELALARGEHAEGLGRYRGVVRKMRELRYPGLVGEPTGYEPWVLFSESAALVAYARHGQPAGEADAGPPAAVTSAGGYGAELYATLRAKLPRYLDPARADIDLPVAGTVMFGLSAWGLATGTLPVHDVVRLAVLADRFGYNRSVPTMKLRTVSEPAESIAPGMWDAVHREYGERRGPDLLEEARRLLEQLA
ncbi:BTAD domain-containing putative transcriptional regulator [Streptomyces oceani]|uniref:Uncharacterized protein n=1 Tax=Streptomyces oceani TaxID=1075402 RepID=A0A1E7KGG6_9ACTN|nr:BTAD domain-containing putative transcriptional regulator [Streptomyces oceani]OEV03005.1 hypothetical protein AN216_13635 [Streptomyces oceani]